MGRHHGKYDSKSFSGAEDAYEDLEGFEIELDYYRVAEKELQANSAIYAEEK